MGRLFDRVLTAVYGPHLMRADAVQRAIFHAHMVASLVARDAAPARVEQYVATCAQADRTAHVWGRVSTVLGGWMPGCFWAGALALGTSGGWWVVAAQVVWALAWFAWGFPHFDFAVIENRMLATYAALSRLCDGVPADALARAGVTHFSGND